MTEQNQNEEAIFEQARLQPSGPQRIQYVEQACAGNETLKRRVLALLAAHEAAAGPLDWTRFLRLASRHQVIGLVHEGLTRVRPDLP